MNPSGCGSRACVLNHSTVLFNNCITVGLAWHGIYSCPLKTSTPYRVKNPLIILQSTLCRFKCTLQIQMPPADVSDHLHSPGPIAELAEGPSNEGTGRNMVASLFSSCKKPSVALSVPWFPHLCNMKVIIASSSLSCSQDSSK